MNIILFYGGFAAAIVLFITALLFFIIFKVPSIHRYFRKNSRKGLVAAEVITGKLRERKKTGPKRVTRAEYEGRTEVITLSMEDTDRINPDRTDYLATGQLDSGAIGPDENGGGTEILDKTDIL